MVKKKQKSRKEKREERSLRLCQEVRYQIVKYGYIADIEKLSDLMTSWMNVTGKEKYEHKK